MCGRMSFTHVLSVTNPNAKKKSQEKYTKVKPEM